ncbi:MAG TPA: hypothetical protein VH542_01875 [Steroidobacteraceae bacterium]|jgi:hypothetical protein
MKYASTWMMLMLMGWVAPVQAAAVKSSFYSPRQVGVSERVQVGLSVFARADGFYLTAGGGYTLTCPDTTPLTAQRALQFVRLQTGYTTTVFVPEVIPAEYSISGWYGWARPSTHYCTFSYTGRAKDAWVSLAGLGINVTLGGDEVSDGNSIVFAMQKLPPPPPACQPFCNACNP